MDLGDDTSKIQGDLDATLPLDVAGGETRSDTDRIRYHLPDNDPDDVEIDDDECPAQYSNTAVLGTTNTNTNTNNYINVRSKADK